MARTGDKCQRSGIYQGDDVHRERIALSRAETFPPYRSCNRAVNWMLVQST